MIAIDLDRNSHIPLFRQLYTGLRTAILEGRIAPSSRLPSTRSLRIEFGVSRNTVMAAFAQLQAEDLIVARVGAGTIVNPVLAGRRRPDRRADRTNRPFPMRLSAAALRVEKCAAIPLQEGFGTGFAFTTALPALDHFPQRAWTRILTANARKLVGLGSDRADPAGYKPLRRAICDYLGAARGVVCDPDQVIVTNGTQQAIDLCARILANPGDCIAVEDPGYPGAVVAFAALGTTIASAPVDEQGLVVASLNALRPSPRMIYTSPSHQFPLGVAMTSARRLDLLEWAAANHAWILEDDYDSEFRHGGPALTALAGMDSGHHVLYVGSFSKTLLPALRLAYVVLPRRLVEPALKMRTAMDLYPSVLVQATATQFMREGYFARHLARTRTVYTARRETLVNACVKHLGSTVRLSIDHTGLRIVAWLRRGLDDVKVASHCRSLGIEVLPMSRFYRNVPPPGPGLMLGFGATTDESVEAGVRALRHAL
jgi:GntR family transcriptional regulator/MocR family aminotransferase